jgi:hypothetical protein
MDIAEYKILMHEKVRLYYSQGDPIKLISYRFAIEQKLIKEICKDVVVIGPKKRRKCIIYL